MVLESTFGQRLRQIMEERCCCYEEFGKLLGMNAQTLNRYVLGRREPKISTATAIALALKVDPIWLQGYDVPRHPPAPPEENGLTERETAVPICAAGYIEGYAAAAVPEPEQYFYIRVPDESMGNAGIRAGDLVLVQRQDTAENGQIAACVIGGGNAVLRRFRRKREVVIFQPEHPDFEPCILTVQALAGGAAKIVGVAVKLVREL